MSPRDNNSEESVKLFISIGLDEKTATENVKNPKVKANLTTVIHQAGVADGCDRNTGNLLYTVATKYRSNVLLHRSTLFEYIVSAKDKDSEPGKLVFNRTVTLRDSYGL